MEALARILTMYADDTLLQMHFDNLPQLQEALQMCDLLLDQLTELGFKGEPREVGSPSAAPWRIRAAGQA